jgi:hypothetical protein
VTPYTAHAQIVEGESVYGRYRDPRIAEITLIEIYRERYRDAFEVYPAGTHWVDSVNALVNLLRPGGIPTSSSGG